jgi:hypothetical protein
MDSNWSGGMKPGTVPMASPISVKNQVDKVVVKVGNNDGVLKCLFGHFPAKNTPVRIKVQKNFFFLDLANCQAFLIGTPIDNFNGRGDAERSNGQAKNH